MRGLIALGVIAFMAGLGVVVGNRMSSEAMAVVVGVVCGVLAGIPTAVLMLVIVRAQQRGTAKGRGGDERPTLPPAHYPPVIVVNPGGHQQLPQQDAGAVDGSWRALRQAPRQARDGAQDVALQEPRRKFRIIGEE